MKYILTIFLSLLGVDAMALQLSSPAFQNNSDIPDIYTCDGKDISPELNWSGAPAEAVSFVLIMDDPDAPMGTWDHWIVFNIPATTNGFKEGETSFPADVKMGKNSGNRIGYGGPCPPDKQHHYYFKLYAVDKKLDLPIGASKSEVLNAITGHILAEAELMGTYDRRKVS